MTKICFRCNVEYLLDCFHKHKGMKDGRLNKCKFCVKKDVDEWRNKNSDCRKKEYQSWVEKTGFIPWKNTKGSKKRSLEYFYRRKEKLKNRKISELDEFAFSEAIDLRDLRKEITGFEWHIDHIVPLNHKDACGLHVACNFQVVPALWNVTKGNRNMDEFFNLTGY